MKLEQKRKVARKNNTATTSKYMFKFSYRNSRSKVFNHKLLIAKLFWYEVSPLALSFTHT